MPKRTFSEKDKLEILKAYETGDYTINQIASIYKVNSRTIYDWKNVFDEYGIEGLKKSTSRKRYSRELKLGAVRDYLSGEYSLRETIRKYKISDKSVLRQWINKYNSHREFKDTAKERTSSMTKGKSTNLGERIQIVLYCLENGKDYQLTAETYEVSYQQVYQWVKKYEVGGEEALRDKRGKKKEETELSPEEKVKLEVKKLESENERLRAENLYLKKLKEIERRRF